MNTSFLRLFLRLTLLGWSFAAFGASPEPGRVALQGHVPEVVSRLQPLGQLPLDTNLSLAIGLPLRNQAELDELLIQLQDPRSTNYHRYLTLEQFIARFGPTEQQYQSVVKFAQSYGLTVAGTHPNRVVLDVQGSAANIGRAFQITLRSYKHPTEARNFFAPDAEPSVPADLPVADMWGLDDYVVPRPRLHKIVSGNAKPRNYNGSGPSGAYQGRDFRNAYAPGAAQVGSGQIVAVAEFDGYYANDITAYENNCGYTNVPLQNVLVDSVSGNPGYSGIQNAVAEVSLDIEMAIAMAPGLAKVIVYEGSNPYDVFNRIVTDKLAKQISCSWGFSTGPSHNWGHPGTKTLDSQLQQMAAQGQSFFEASGDSDAYTGSQALNSITGPIPQDSIYLTCVGGTTLAMNGAGSSYASETVWNWGNNIGSGGGVSPNYVIPSWQAGVDMSFNGGSSVNRNLPDVALTADAIFVVYNNGGSGIFGGTSCAAPLWAGFAALVNQQAAGAAQPPVGFLNPALYAIGTGSNYAACFHDTTVGDNIGANTPGLFYATNGFDLCTGWGTPTGTNLINVLAPHPCVLTPPLSQTATNGNNVMLSVAAGGQSPFSYRWRFNGTNLASGPNVAGITSNVLTLSSVTLPNSGNYSVVVSNNFGSVTSAVAALTVVFPPSFTTQPTNQSVPTGGTALFDATATGASPLVYQWRKNGANVVNGGSVSGATSNALKLTAVTLTNAGNYTLVVTNVFGSATSSVATLTVQQGPTITLPPAPQTAQCGSNVAFSATASGTPPLTYHWSLDGVAAAFATTNILSLTNVHLPDHTVAVVVTNLYGSATSSVTLTVQDTLAPIITLHGSNPFYVELGSAFTDPGATANDLCAGTVPAIAGGVINTSAIGTNTLLYTATDGNGNTNTAARTVIVRDTTPPTILSSFTNLTLAAGTNCAAEMPDVTGTNYIIATDLSGALTISQSPTTNANLLVGTNAVIITVADSSGNASRSTNQIVVLDETPPLIQTQPQSQTNTVGATAAFSVTATACTPAAYQWFFGSAPLPSQTNSTLTLPNITAAAAGNYSAVASASGGSATSVVATLTVNLLGSSLTMTSSENPSGFNDSVNFTSTVTPATATGTIQFFTNGVAFDLEMLVAGQAVSTNLALLPRGTNVITAIYSGDAADTPSTNTLAQIVTNHPPALAVIPDQTITVGTTLLLTNAATDPDGDPMTYAFEAGAATNATIDSATGLFSWTPVAAQAGTNSFTVIVTDNGQPPLSASQSFTVTVVPSNSPPVLAPVSDQTIYALSTLSLTNSATDADVPPQTLSFSLDPGAPLGSSIGATNGIFQWTPTDSQTGPHAITVRVTDNGTPELSDTQTFTVSVLSRPVETITVSNNLVTLTWSAIPSTAYRIQFKTDLSDAAWTDLVPDVLATGAIASATYPITTNAFSVYRLLVRP